MLPEGWSILVAIQCAPSSSPNLLGLEGQGLIPAVRLVAYPVLVSAAKVGGRFSKLLDFRVKRCFLASLTSRMSLVRSYIKNYKMLQS